MMFTEDMTPLQRAQVFNQSFAERHKQIYEAMRAASWSHEDALEEADAREDRALLRAEKDAGL